MPGLSPGHAFCTRLCPCTGSLCLCAAKPGVLSSLLFSVAQKSAATGSAEPAMISEPSGAPFVLHLERCSSTSQPAPAGYASCNCKLAHAAPSSRSQRVTLPDARIVAPQHARPSRTLATPTELAQRMQTQFVSSRKRRRETLTRRSGSQRRGAAARIAFVSFIKCYGTPLEARGCLYGRLLAFAVQKTPRPWENN